MNGADTGIINLIYIKGISMDLLELKESFLSENANIDERYRKALSLAIDCLIDNESEKEDIPIVLASYDEMAKHHVSHLLKQFCKKAYPNSGISFDANSLFLFGNDLESCCKYLIRHMRSYEQSLVYLADSPSGFENLPSGLFHIVDIGYETTTRYKNTMRGDTPRELPQKEYSSDDALKGLFDLVSHGSAIDSCDTSDARDLLFDECNACILRPISAPKGAKFSEKITIKSSDWEKHACVALRRYQSRECGDGMSWDTSDAGWKNVEAYPLTDRLAIPGTQDERDCLIGLVTMNITEGCPALLSTVWIHPLYRRQGRFKDLWRELKHIYGDFEVEQPNANMRAFMSAMGEEGRATSP